MIVTCPSCQTQYRLDAASFGPKGRSVRCANCGNRWRCFAASPALAATAPTPARHQPVATLVAPPVVVAAAVDGGGDSRRIPLGAPPPPAPREARSGRGDVVGWLLAALLAMLLVAAIVGRNEIVAALPAALPVYQRLGLPVTLRLGLEFRALASERRDEGDRGALIVTGEVHNVSGQERQVPQLRVALLDEGRQEIDAGSFDAPQKVLPPGGSTRFEIRLPNPPATARNFHISFAETP